MKALGWLLYFISGFIYLLLWIDAFRYISDKIGSFLTIFLILVTNVINPIIYIIWHWINNGFPTDYFVLLIVAWVIGGIGNFLVSSSNN